MILPSSPYESDHRLYLSLGRVCFIKYLVLVVIRSRYNSNSSCYRRSRLFEQIKFPAGVHHISQHARSPLSGHICWGHARPRKINTSQPYIGTTERSAHRSKSYGAGVWSHHPLHTCTLRTRPVSRPSLPYTRAGVPVQPGARRSIADVKKASADTTTSSAHNCSRVVGYCI